MLGKIITLTDDNVTVAYEGNKHTYPRDCIKYSTPEVGDRIILTKDSEGVKLLYNNDNSPITSSESANYTQTSKVSSDYYSIADWNTTYSRIALILSIIGIAVVVISFSLCVLTENEYFLIGISSVALSVISFYLTLKHNDKSKCCLAAYMISGITMGAVLMTTLIGCFGFIGFIIFIIIAILAIVIK